MKKLRVALVCLLILSHLVGCSNTDLPIVNTYTLSFVTNGGNAIESLLVEEGNNITIPTNPIRAGYTFEGWYLDNFTFEQSALTKLNEPVISSYKVYAKWKIALSDNPRIIINLADGRKIRLELYPDVAPITVANFLSLIDEGYYTNTIFHRIIEDFMIQAGMLELDDEAYVYKPSRNNIIGEFSNNGYTNNLSHTIGIISMARATAMDSASTQFFICSASSTHLNGDYAAFGKTLDTESTNVVISLSYSNTVTLESMANFPLTADGSLIVISSIERMASDS